jgi:hypothetical protein
VEKAKVKAGKRTKNLQCKSGALKDLMLLLEKNHKDDTKYVYWLKWSSTRRFSRYFEDARTVF